jgi:hypothetical protein
MRPLTVLCGCELQVLAASRVRQRSSGCGLCRGVGNVQRWLEVRELPAWGTPSSSPARGGLSDASRISSQYLTSSHGVRAHCAGRNVRPSAHCSGPPLARSCAVLHDLIDAAIPAAYVASCCANWMANSLLLSSSVAYVRRFAWSAIRPCLALVGHDDDEIWGVSWVGWDHCRGIGGEPVLRTGSGAVAL